MFGAKGSSNKFAVPYEQLYQVAVVIIICASYYNSLFGAFIWDDRAAVIANKDVTSNRPWYNTFSNDFWGQNIRLEDSHKSYRPVTTLSYRLDHEIYGLSAFGFHLTNILIYILTCLAFYHLACHWLSSTGAKVAGLIFAVHPIHVESVASIVGRADCLCGLFYILAVLCYQYCLDSASVGTASMLFFLFAWCFAMFSTFSKEIGFTIFGLFGVLEILHQIQAVMRQHPDFRWLKVTGEVIRKKSVSNHNNSNIQQTVSLLDESPVTSTASSNLFTHPKDYLTGLLVDGHWNKTFFILKTALNTRLNIFSSTTTHHTKNTTNNKSSSSTTRPSYLGNFDSANSLSTSWSFSSLPSWNLALRALPFYTWFRLLSHVLTILVFFQFRSWLHGPQYMYNWTIMENHIALMPTFFPDRVLSYAQHHFWYMWKFVYPRHLCFDYGYECVPVITSLYDWRNILPLSTYVLIVAAITHAVYHLRVTLLFGWALWLSSLLPALNILMPVGNLLAERLMFVPSIGFCLVIAEYITVDGGRIWYEMENYLFAWLDALDQFFVRFQVQWDEAVSATATATAGTKAATNHVSRRSNIPESSSSSSLEGVGNKDIFRNSKHAQPLPRVFQLNDGLSVYVNSSSSGNKHHEQQLPAKKQVRIAVEKEDLNSSGTDGEAKSDEDSSYNGGGEDSPTQQKRTPHHLHNPSKEFKKTSPAAKKSKPSSKHSSKKASSSVVAHFVSSLAAYLNCFSFLWTWSFWADSVQSVYTNTQEKAEIHRKQQPSAIVYQGKLALFLIGWPVLALAMMRIVSRNLDWRSELSIYSSALSVCPRSLKALSNTAVLMSANAEYNVLAAQYVDTCVEIYQNNSVGLINQGLAQQRLGNVLPAVMALERSLVAQHPIEPPVKAEGYLSGVLYKWATTLPIGATFTGRSEDDIRQNLMRQAHLWSLQGINRGFQSPLMLYNAANMAAEVQELDTAIKLYEYAITTQRAINEQMRLSSNTIPHEDNISLRYAFNMYGLALASARRFQEAMVAYENSIRLHREEDGGTDPLPSIINLAQMLNHHLNRTEEARALMHQYLRTFHFPSNNTSNSSSTSDSNVTHFQSDKNTILTPPPSHLPVSEWPILYGTPADWEILQQVALTVPPILWNNLGFVHLQLGHVAVAAEYFARGLYTAKQKYLGYNTKHHLHTAVTTTTTTTTAAAFTSSMQDMVVSADLPAILLENWKKARVQLQLSADVIPEELQVPDIALTI